MSGLANQKKVSLTAKNLGSEQKAFFSRRGDNESGRTSYYSRKTGVLPEHPLGATMSTGFKNVFQGTKNIDCNNPRYAASKASSVMGGLITGMHTRNGTFNYDGPKEREENEKPISETAEEKDEGTHEELEEDGE
jgi:hypothetical protein